MSSCWAMSMATPPLCSNAPTRTSRTTAWPPLALWPTTPLETPPPSYGTALNDPNFNCRRTLALEGTGADKVYYQIPEATSVGAKHRGHHVSECGTKVMPPKWVAPMLELQGDSLIDGFRALYSEFIPTPEAGGSRGASMTVRPHQCRHRTLLDNQTRSADRCAPTHLHRGQVRMS